MKIIRPIIVVVSLLLLSFTPSAIGADTETQPPEIAGYPQAEALELGRRLYLEGIGSDGQPVQATVQGDIPVDGSMFTCVSCHLRSGLGSWEGTVITLPTNGRWLYNEVLETNSWRLSAQEARKRYAGLDAVLSTGVKRPAYNDQSLARSIWAGAVPGGRTLSLTMPRYDLSQKDMALLIAYLKTMSSTFDPGIADDTVHLATVITDEVDPADREAMLAALQTHINNHNSQVRKQGEKEARGPWYRAEKYKGWRRLELHVWELKGAPETWRDQLEALYAATPVFALLGGISTLPWEPIHRFCEDNRLPSLFPVTDLPVISDTDWYTLYVSKGLYHEGESLARFLRKKGRLPANATLVQIHDDSARSQRAARGFSEAWERFRKTAPVTFTLQGGKFPSKDQWEETLSTQGPLVLLWWLGEGSAKVLEQVEFPASATVYASATLWGDEMFQTPAPLRSQLRFTHPLNLKGDREPKMRLHRAWLKARKLTPHDFRIQGETYFMGWVLPMLMHGLRDLYFRDYLFDRMDMMNDETHSVPPYPRLSFGPGQRYALKRCSIVQLSGEDPPQLLPVEGGNAF